METNRYQTRAIIVNNVNFLLGITGSIVIALAMAAAGSSGGLTVWGIPLFAFFGVFAFGVQWVVFIPAYIYQTEKYFDLLGSLTYVTLAAAALYCSDRDPGAIGIALMVMIWAARLGSFLFIRIRRVGHDTRFRSIKPDFLQFLMTWTLQGLWVFLTFGAGLAALTSGKPHPLDGFVILGGTLWLIGFLIEVTADRQKSEFRQDPLNAGKFITHGLWAWSRHPNYFGEILLWSGIAVAALPALGGWQYVTLISPVFVYILLTRISGVRMLEQRARRKWGDDEGYQDYCRRTPVLLLNPMLAHNRRR
jgi:steroid 5-alpha reductase family enzyme